MRKAAILSKVSRRQVFRSLALSMGVVLAMAGRRSPAGNAPAAQTPGTAPHLDVEDPAAVAVGYVESAAKVDTKKSPNFVQGSNCENCLQLQGTSGAPYRPCTLFPGKLVAAAGWCSAWTAEM